MKNGKEYENLYSSAVARAEADWLVGINATRALTTKFNAQLSCGRVQTPTLAMIAKREEEIKNFKPTPYYEIKAITDGLNLKWQHEKTKEQRIFKKDISSSIVRSLQGQKAKIIDVQISQKKSYAPHLYDLTELQRDANKRFGFSAKETLNVLQKLYEHHKLVTYPRTDSKYLSTDIIDTLKDRIEGCMVQPYAKLGSKILKNGIKTNKSFIDNSKVTDHHAIIPTEERPNLQALSAKEEKIYDLIVKRFLAVFLPPYTYEQKTVHARIGNELFVAKGITVNSLGWKEVITAVDENDDEGQIPALIQPGMNLNVLSVKEIEKETQPPKPFNEGTLLSAMENPAKYMAGESKDLIDTIGKTGGLGTVATRADIIDKLFNTFLIEKRGQDIHITNKGKQLLELVPEDLKSPVLSAEWEQKLEQIAKGRLKKNAFISDIKQYTKEVVSDIKMSDSKFKHDNITGTKCPDCGKLMLEVNGKKGKMLVCQDRECGHRKNIAKLTNARCPNCHKKMELRGEGEGQLFVCKCGHREKLSAFNERRKKNQNGKLSKKEVSNYMKKQQKEEPINTALADALAKLKL